MFLIVDLETIFIIKFVGMGVIYFYNKFHFLNSNGSFAITITPKAIFYKRGTR
jgi:hypothetical protein